MNASSSLHVVGIIESCFKEKFGIPRQPGLASAATARLILQPPYNVPTACQGLEGVSHLWLVFGFHAVTDARWRPTVRPPRLGGNTHMGVFATRSTHRPNGIGLSVVTLERVEIIDGGTVLHLSGVDVLDGTPVYDIKPYVPYVDCIEHATNTLAADLPAQVSVILPPALIAQCADYQQQTGVDLALLLQQVLAQDPAPAYHPRQPGREYGMRLLEFNIRWRYLSWSNKTSTEAVPVSSGEEDEAAMIAIEVIAIEVVA